MSGIFGYTNRKNESLPMNSFYNKIPGLSSFLYEEKNIPQLSICVGRKHLNKFLNKRFFEETEDVVYCVEGVFYNNEITKDNFASLFEEDSKALLRRMKGVFNGFYLNKKTNHLYLFNDKLSSRNIFYHKSKENGFCFSSRIYILSQMLRKLGVEVKYNKESVYSFTLLGQLFSEQTLLTDVHLLKYASILTVNLTDFTCTEESYFTYETPIQKISYQDALYQFNTLFTQSVEQEWELDKKSKYNHMSLLSGGMDSRLNLLTAKDLGYNASLTYSYGNPSSSDLKIAENIAKGEKIHHFQHHINSGDFLLTTIDDYIKCNDATVSYPNSASMVDSLRKLDFSNYGVLHSGQIGGIAKGESSIENFDYHKNMHKIILNGFIGAQDVLEKLPSFKKVLSSYEGKNFEYFTIEQRCIRATLAGDKVASCFIDQTSPFFDEDLNLFICSLPNNYKFNKRMFWDWLFEYRLDALQYKYERIGLKPNKKWKIPLGEFYKKYSNGARKYFNLNYDSMNPVSTWMKENPNLLKQLDQIFNIHIDLIIDKELKEDLTNIYKNDIFEYRNRFSVISVLKAINLMQND